jgi:HTH-type transcriptional regulator, transcriptional repressor of NAD biosynthesis genes
METRAAHGLVLGKFMPLTNGHRHLIDTALRQVRELTVLVCSLPAEPIDGDRRYRWMRECYPHARVVHVVDELPSYPHEHPDFWALWRACIQQAAPPVDVVFTSEDYGDRLAAELGARHVLVDPARQTVPISATRVRANPLAFREYLPPCVRPYYVKRVLLVGPESTGKTTLAQQLAAHFATTWVPEYGREYVVARGNRFAYDDVLPIAFGQAESEETRAREANRLLFCDTDWLTTLVWSEFYFGRSPLALQRLVAERRYDLTLLLDVDLPWENDGTRELGHRRAEFRDAIRAELTSRRIPYTTIQGTGPARLHAAIAAVQPLLARA